MKINGIFIVSFKTGAFLSGTPIQPIVLKYYGDEHFYPSWETIPIHIWVFHFLIKWSHPIQSENLSSNC